MGYSLKKLTLDKFPSGLYKIGYQKMQFHKAIKLGFVTLRFPQPVDIGDQHWLQATDDHIKLCVKVQVKGDFFVK